MIDGAVQREHSKRYTSVMRFRAEHVKRCECCHAIVSAFGGWQHQRVVEWHDGIELVATCTLVATCMSHYCRARAAKGTMQ